MLNLENVVQSGTIFYRKRVSQDEILETLALLAEGNRISSLTRVKGHKEDTILKWLREAASHATAVEEVLLKEYHIKRGQLDGLWLYVGNKVKKGYPETSESGQFIRSTMIDMETRLRVACAIEKDETQASIGVFQMLKRRGHPDGPPPTLSDGWGGIDQAMIEVYGIVPERGRPPTRKKPGTDWLYLQMVKQRDASGHFIGTKLKAIFGSLENLIRWLGQKTLLIARV